MRDRIKIWLVKGLCGSVVGWFLHRANSCPPYLTRDEFYRVKTSLCQRFGWWQRAELQHILKECWECDARAVVVKGCRKCLNYGMRPGVWDEFWVRLELWKVGRYYFHQPTARYYRKIEWHGQEIEGYIQHERHTRFRLHSECWLWLALFFDRKAFKRELLVDRGGWLPLLLTVRIYQATQGRFWQRKLQRWQHRLQVWRLRRALILPKFEAERDEDIPF